MKSVTTKAGVESMGPAALEERRGLRHDIVRRVLIEIFRGHLPPGTRLITQKLSKQLGISATPLREALVELEAIGMVEISHNRGAVAAPFGPEQLRGIYQVRRVLESEAARGAFGRIDRQMLETLREEFVAYARRRSKSAAWLRSAMEADGRLHSTIAAACGSPRLAREIDRYALLMQTISAAIGNRHHSQEDAVREHIAIIDALLSGTREDCGRAMAKHIDSTAKRVITVMFAGRE
ncbi:MAG: GntR family transcriptional regulator [Planctomycetia bacterium]